MPRVVTRPPRSDGRAATATIRRDPDALAAVIEDAAHFPGGHAAGVAAPRSEAEAAELVRTASAVLPIGAQSSLTGGATPMGEVVLSTARLNRILEIGDDWVRAQAGVSLSELDAVLASSGKWYPPAPTFMGASVGGVIATNAAGAATFKYGTTRDWIRQLTVVLANGDVLDVTRGEFTPDAAGRLEIALSDRAVRVSIPTYRMPAVPKVSAGYFAVAGMDLIDLFIGSEGTLGVVIDATLRVVRHRPATCLAFAPFADVAAAVAFVSALRAEARATWQSRNPAGLDVSAIEHIDARCIQLLRDTRADERYGVRIPETTATALLISLELAPEMTTERAFDEIGKVRDPAASETRLMRFCRALDAAGVLDAVEIAVPGDHARAAQLLALREAVPEAVNALVGRAKRDIDSSIAKTAADMIVPFDRLPELMALYAREFAARGLDAAVWGHISDGNLHPNVIPRSVAEMESGKAAILAFGREVIRMGGSPLAEHGVGRNPVKQHLLAEMYGETGIAEMRAIKRALDPDWKLAPGVLFPR
jgi:D-lactate dehydrogenase (cytochrome)